MTQHKGFAVGLVVVIAAVFAGSVVASATGTWFLPTYSGAFCGDYPDDPRCQSLGQAVFQPNVLAGAISALAILMLAALQASAWYSARRGRAG